MDWKELKIFTSHTWMENLSAALISAGVTGLVIFDPNDIRDFAAEKNSSWDYIDEELLKEATAGEPFVTVYLPTDDDGAAQLEAIYSALDRLKSLGADLRMETGSIREEDWANEWKKFFKPQPVGKRLIIKPSWETVNDPQGRVIIELDPESSFGTGRHFTTQLCLELMEQYLEPGDEIIDLGCGSGIIFISALKLGAKNAVGVDISEDAVRISRKNALSNNISEEQFEVYRGDIVTDPGLLKKACKGYELVTANIVADVLLAMTDAFRQLVKPDGKLVLSGIIDDRLDEVISAVKQKGFIFIEQKHRDIWNAAVFKG